MSATISPPRGIRGPGGVFRENKNASVFSIMGRAALPPNDDFISKDGAGGCERSRRKRNRHTDRNEKRRELLLRSSPPGGGDPCNKLPPVITSTL